MKKHVGTAVGMLIAFMWSDLAAAQPVPACSLLTSSEVGSAVGGNAGPGQEKDVVIPNGPSKGETMATCMWPIEGQSMVNVSVIRAPKGEQREAGLARLRQAFTDLEAKGWKPEKKDFGNGTCLFLTPPASIPNAPTVTSCFAEAKGLGMSVAFMGGKQNVAIEKVKSLLDKVIGRLP